MSIDRVSTRTSQTPVMHDTTERQRISPRPQPSVPIDLQVKRKTERWQRKIQHVARSKSDQITTQHELFRLSKVRSAARVAASKTSSTPSPVRDEHSRYLRAPIDTAISWPSFVVTNFRDFLRISSIAIGSSRRSFFNPTKRIGTPGHRSFASSIHYIADQYHCDPSIFLRRTLCFTFSSESGVSIANPIRRT
jgi:hypothetical protein